MTALENRMIRNPGTLTAEEQSNLRRLVGFQSLNREGLPLRELDQNYRRMEFVKILFDAGKLGADDTVNYVRGTSSSGNILYIDDPSQLLDGRRLKVLDFERR